MTSPSSASPGWYQDPDDPTLQRLFDGVNWTASTRKPPGKFAAKYRHRTAGVWLLVIAVLFAFGIPGAISAIAESSSGSDAGGAVGGLIFLLVVAGGFAAWSAFLLRGRGENPARAAEEAQRRLAAEEQFHAAVNHLSAVRTGAAGLVALRNVGAAADSAFGAEGPARAAAAIASVGVDPSTFNSPRLGVLAAIDTPTWLEVYRDWVIFGQLAYDVDEHTKMTVHLDGAVQMVARQVTRGNQQVTVTEPVDMRQAVVQVVSEAWWVSVHIKPDNVNEARRIGDQLATQVAKLQPKAASSADIKAMVDSILNSTGQPIAEKLKQLSNLRYDRILSDEEFASAKDKLLANPGVQF